MTSSLLPTPHTGAGRSYGLAASVFGLLGVAAGAFGAHAVRDTLPPALMSAFETAARYQLIHAVALLVVALYLDRNPSRALAAAGNFFLAGTILFSGSLYALALSGRTMWGMVTPFGGLCFLAGWLCLATAFASRPKESA